MKKREKKMSSEEAYERLSRLKKYDDDEFAKNFLNVIKNDRSVLDELIKIADFQANWHDIHRGCPSGAQQCSHCYSGDTEFEMSHNTILKEVWKKAYKQTDLYDDSDAEDPDSEDPNSEKDYFIDDGKKSSEEGEDQKEKEEEYSGGSLHKISDITFLIPLTIDGGNNNNNNIDDDKALRGPNRKTYIITWTDKEKLEAFCLAHPSHFYLIKVSQEVYSWTVKGANLSDMPHYIDNLKDNKIISSYYVAGSTPVGSIA